ncbi:hypothetical protein OSH11_22355 [Kaistia dalseonensis]|uniref:Lipoprotein n=1 Tax=Kaistia dalseonensis TaxID=410840 RepID=A0ABU0HDR9_9HYPH|nr:hypothetical protein [Kaistia dalseonensis]MCX5497458.1 hypothetical protein [Kaistia dalseonensis]MDQ0440097.1 hypothetical protein [Kaistia dalseonensis]
MLRSTARGVAQLRRLTIFVSVAGLSALLSACMGMGGENTSPAATVTAPDGLQTTKDGSIILNAQNFGKVADVDCPPLMIRPGTEALVVHQAPQRTDQATGTQPAVIYQASIVNTARECRQGTNGVIVKVGVQGRVVGGPAAKAGTINLPLRVVVMQGTDKVLKSELNKVAVNLQAPDFSGDFIKVDDGIEVPVSPGNTDFRIYIGFDDSKKG